MRKKLTMSEIELLKKSGCPKKAINYYVNMTKIEHMLDQMFLLHTLALAMIQLCFT